MFKVVAALLAAALFLSPVDSAFAISSESSTDAGAGANVADPDNQTDQTDQTDGATDPSSGTDGSTTIEVPPVDEPGDSDDYTPPDSEDDSGDAPADPAPTGTSN